ncbi:hypothetical protein B0H14DRAFT_2778033, partial [Mycena olivaceomarginata]
MPLLPSELCENCGKHSPAVHTIEGGLEGDECDQCAILKRCGGCALTLYCDKACQKGHRRVHRPFCETEQSLLNIAQLAGRAKEYENFKTWCRTSSLEISRNAGATGYTMLSAGHFYLVHYPAKSGIWAKSSDFSTTSEGQTTILVVNQSLPHPLSTYTINIRM